MLPIDRSREKRPRDDLEFLSIRSMNVKPHTMFVDKMLSSVTAVQPLSQLNRTIRQEGYLRELYTEAIRKAFVSYYEETEPNVVYAPKNTLNEYRVLSAEGD